MAAASAASAASPATPTSALPSPSASAACPLSLPLSSLLAYDPATILAIRTALSPLNKISQISRNFLDCGLTFSAHTCGCMSVGVPACMQVCVCLCACMRVCVFVCLSLLSLASSNYFLQFSSIAQVQFKIISQRFGCLAPSPFLSLPFYSLSRCQSALS